MAARDGSEVGQVMQKHDAGRQIGVTRNGREQSMDAAPERFHYVPLPRLPQPRPPRPRIPSFHTPRLRLEARIHRSRRAWAARRSGVQTWCTEHALDLAVWAGGLTVAAAMGLGVSQL
jgi:hypothetical protein